MSPRSSGMTRLRVAIATSGRFYVLDLARELDALGHDVKFYSYVPRTRAMRFGLPARCHVALLPLVAPLVVWEHRGARLWPRLLERLMLASLNRAVIMRLQPCDVFHCMSGIYLEAAAYAKRRFGAKVHLDRGSRHILSQREILAAIPGAQGPSDYFVARELAGYALADRIVVPSRHVAESFARDPVAAAKLFVNRFGVDLEQFPQIKPAKLEHKTVLFVGGWTYRKGVDLLTDAIEHLPDVSLLHVGNLGDAPFPAHPRFVHHDPVPQWRLTEFYAKAHLLAMASREEGLALVQAQALASGLPLVCTDRTGGADLAHSPALAKRIRVVPTDNVVALKEGIKATLDAATALATCAPLAEEDRQLLSWRAYGARWADELRRTI